MISRQELAAPTQSRRSLYDVIELPLLLASPSLHIWTHSGVLPDDDPENELVPETPHLVK
jgi:hypothetical protein